MNAGTIRTPISKLLSPPGSDDRRMHTRRSRPQHRFGQRSIWRCWISWARRPTRRSTGFSEGRRAARFVRTVRRIPRNSRLRLSTFPGRYRGIRARPTRIEFWNWRTQFPRIAISSSRQTALLTPGDAASVAKTLESKHPLWFDEPCAHSNIEAVRKVSDETVVPLGLRRGIEDPGVFQALLREGLIDLVRPEIGIFGISGARRIAALAEPYYVAVAPRHDGGPVAHRRGNSPRREHSEFLHPARAAAGR